MLEYKQYGKNGEQHTYGFSYQECRDKYWEFRKLKDAEFLKRLPEAIHLACFICFLKEIPTYNCLNDRGIVHELAHLLHLGEDNNTPLKEIRGLFRKQLELS